MNIAYNMDCLVGMREYPDRYFDLAIVDPDRKKTRMRKRRRNVNQQRRSAKEI